MVPPRSPSNNRAKSENASEHRDAEAPSARAPRAGSRERTPPERLTTWVLLLVRCTPVKSKVFSSDSIRSHKNVLLYHRHDTHAQALTQCSESVEVVNPCGRARCRKDLLKPPGC